MIYINDDKLQKIKLKKSNFYVAIDFDKTITSNESSDCWDIGLDNLGEEYSKKSQMLYQKYAPIELNYNIDIEEKNKAMEEWWYGSLKLFYDYGLTLENIKQSINNSNYIFRPYAKEFLYKMYENEIPVIILSAGIGNVIEEVLYKNNCYYNNIDIISNFFTFDESGKIEEFKGKLIHTLNKTMKGYSNSKFKDKLENKEYRLLIGDFIEDKKMVPSIEWDRTISIRIIR